MATRLKLILRGKRLAESPSFEPWRKSSFARLTGLVIAAMCLPLWTMPVYAYVCQSLEPINAGRSSSALTKDNRAVAMWGANYSGQLGIGTTRGTSSPFTVVVGRGRQGLSNIKQVSVGGTHSLAVSYDGKAWSWGSNAFATLGNGERTGGSFNGNQTRPVRVLTDRSTTLKNVVQVSAGALSSMALDRSGFVWAWGAPVTNSLGTKAPDGDDRFEELFAVPVLLESGERFGNIQSIVMGNDLFLALDNDDEVWIWGSGARNREGRSVKYPTPLYTLDDVRLRGVIDMDSDRDNALLVDKTGRVWGVGDNRSGELGVGDDEDRDLATLVVKDDGTPLRNIRKVATGDGFALALDFNGGVWHWGSGKHFPGMSDSFHPQRLLDTAGRALRFIADIDATNEHMAAIDVKRRVIVGGHNSYDALGAGPRIGGDYAPRLYRDAAGRIAECGTGVGAVTPLTINRVDASRLGWLYGTSLHRNRVEYSFLSRNGQGLLFSLRGFDIDSSDKAQVLLNDKPIGALRRGRNARHAPFTHLALNNVKVGENRLVIRPKRPGTQYGASRAQLRPLEGPVVKLTEGRTDANRYGFNYGDGRHPVKLRVTFARNRSGNGELRFRAYDIDSDDEVAVYLNGTRLSNLQTTENNGERFQSIAIEQSVQQDQNTVEFVQATPGHKWGVRKLLFRAL